MVYKKTRTTRLYQVVKTTCSTGTNKHIIVIVDRSTLQKLAQHQATTQATSTARARAMAVATTMRLCHSFKRVKQTSHKERQQLLTKILQWTRLIMRVRPKTMSPVTRASWCVIQSQATMTVLTCFPDWVELMMNTAIKIDDVVDDGMDNDAGTMLVHV
jgi:hypothetical protein